MVLYLGQLEWFYALIGGGTIAGAAAFIFSKQSLSFDKSKKPQLE